MASFRAADCSKTGLDNGGSSMATGSLTNSRVLTVYVKLNLFWRFFTIRQTAKLKSSPNFPGILPLYPSFHVTQMAF